MKIRNSVKTGLLIVTLPFAIAACGNHLAASGITAASQMKPEVVKISDKIEVLKLGGIKVHTYYGISNSHIIETENEIRMIDAQMTFNDARAVKAYIDTLGKPLKAVILSHNHPDHWFGAEVFAKDKTPILASINTTADLAQGGKRYIKIMKKKFNEQIPDNVIIPTGTVELGKQVWDGLNINIEEYKDQEAHHSILVKLPDYRIMIGQDLVYNNRFLVASERNRNKNWVKILETLKSNETNYYQTILVGHGPNTGTGIFQKNIDYLNVLEGVLEQGLTEEKTKQAMLNKYPEMKGKGLLAISIKNLFHPH